MRKEGAFRRGIRLMFTMLMALVLAVPMSALPAGAAYADTGDAQAATAENTLEADDSELKIAVLSDTHYYPLNYVSDCEDYETYVGGDPKMLEESGSILDAALAMVRQDSPDVLLVSGDLTKDGEKLGHQQLAQRFQQLEDETDTEVFVINGNHDIYNYQDSCTFENGKKESAETTTPAEFKEIYKNFGYDGNWDAQYFTNPQPGEQAGGLSYSVDLGKFTIVAIDSGMYSPDAGTGYDTNEHVTAGRVDEDLVPWVVQQTKDAEAEGDTVIGLMHHGLVPHFSMEDQILSEYVVDNWQETATAFADAGMRYIFTGHMHANDISQFTSNAGNTITDLETGSLSSWMSPARTITLTKGAALDDGTARTHESFSVSSESVKSISFKDHTGKVTEISDLKSYTQEKLYPKTLFNNMANGMLRPVLAEIGEQGIRPWLAENLPGVDIDALVLDAVPGLLEGGMDIELGTGIGRVHVEYRNGGIQLQPSGTAGLIGSMTITDAQLLRVVDDVLDKIETRYIDNPDWLLDQIDKIVTKVSNTGVASLDADEKTIYDLVFVCLTGHYAGCENPPAWVDDALEYIQQGDIISELIDGLIDDLMPVLDDILSNTSIDTGIAFSGIWKTAIDSMTDDGNLKATLDTFGFDEAAIRGLIEGLINEYMSPSFLTGMGSLISEIASSMLYDSNFTDDEIDSGTPVVIEFDGKAVAVEPSVDNGLLPTQVTMTLGGSSQTDRNFRWYTGTNVTSGTVQVATDAGFGNIVAEATANSEEVVKPKTQLNLGLVATYGTQRAEKHSASVSGLAPGTTYYYRVGDKEQGWWSSGFQFVTGDAADTDESFTFINVNDSQGMVESDYDVYKNTLSQADATFPGAAFTVHGGDFVDDGANEDYWTWALDDENGVAQGMSMTPAAGNHEAKSDVEGITDANPIVSHFNLANVPQGQDLSTGVYYSYTYKNATFVVLNTNDLAADESLSQTQYDWAYSTLANASTEWKIVLMHKSPYSNGPHQSDSDVAAIRSQVNALAAACDVDLVLSGHDHVYNRTPYLAHGEEQDVDVETQTYKGRNYEAALNPNGTAFVIAGTCGVKNYVQTPSASIPSEVALDLSVPVYSGITIDGDHLYYQAYKVNGGSSSLVDSFAISKSEDDVPAWKQVENMIASLPEQSDVTVDDEAAITAARAAYDELSAEDKEKVSNYDRLVAAERMLALLQSVAGKRTVTVSNDEDFYDALADSSVGTIITQGTIEFDEGGLFDDGTRELYVRRDVVVGGTGELKFCRFHVENGATLVLKDSVYVNDTRTQGSWYDALNPVEVNAGGTLITQGSVSLRTEYGTGGSDEGVAVKLMGSGATAILGSSGTYWGSEAAVLSTASGTTLVINDGTYNAKNSNRVVIDTHGDATVNGGTISSMWISGTLRVNGGTFEHQDSASSNWTPLAISGGNAYITGGEFKTYGGRDGNVSVKLENGARVHVLAANDGNVKFGNVSAYVGSPATENYKDVKLGYAKTNGWNASQDGVYRVDGAAAASSVEDIAALSASRMDTNDVSDNGNYMTTVLPNGTSTVFGKYWLYGSGKNAPADSGIIGSGEVIVYGPTRTIQNNPVTGVTIDGETTRVIDLSQAGADTLRLNGYTTPANAFDNGINWSSDNEQTASVAASAGQGIVTVKQPGGANITATSASNPDASAKVEVVAVKPALSGPEVLDEETETASYEANKGFESAAYDGRLSFKYSVSDGTVASIDEDTGALTKLNAGNTKVVATLYLDGAPTGITVEKDVVCKMKPEVSVDDVNKLLDVQVTDVNETMANQHTAQTFDALIENTAGDNDAYSIGEVYAEDEPAANVLEGAAQLLGLEKADKVWKVDVTIQAAPYIKAFDEALQLPEGTHTVARDSSKTVTLVWSDGDLAAGTPASWTLEDPNATPVSFAAKCVSHTVSFSYVGAPSTATTPDAVAVLHGSTYEPATPDTGERYSFEGWFTDPECTDAYNPKEAVNGDITLYGKWVQVKPEAPAGADAADELDALIDVTVTEGNEQMKGTHKDLIVSDLIDGSYTVGEVSGNGTDGYTVDIVISADKYIERFEAQEESEGVDYGDHEVSGETSKTVTLSWNAESGTWGIAEGSSGVVSFTASCTFYTVSFAYVGAPEGTQTPEAQSVQNGKTLAALPEAGDIVGYTFGGWYSDEACETEFVAADMAITEATTVYGKWSPNTYTVSFDADGDGQADADIEGIEVTYDSAWPELPTPDAAAGKNFQGWYLNDAPVTDAGTVKIVEDMVLTAKWSDKPAIEVTPDEDNAAYVYDGEGHGFAFTKAPDNALEGFTVQYRPAGSTDETAWTTETPVNAGSYDVRVTRAEDDTYAAFEQTFEGGVKIAKAKSATPDVSYSEGEAPGSVMVILQNGDADAYYWSESDDKSDATEAENARFEVSEPGTYYAWGAGDENHEDSDFAEAVIVQVTFDDNDGAEGDESEGATFTKGAAQVLLPKGQCLNSWGGLPAVEWEGHEFLGWQLPDGKELAALTAVGESVTATAQWAVEPGAVTPAAPTGQAVAELEGVSVALHGVNEINSDEGNKSHPDVTFAAAGDGVQALIADSFTATAPIEGKDGVWTAQVTMDAQKYLDAYAQMGNPAYGAHYFASPDEDGQETFTIVYDETARAWKIADGQNAAFAYDITCLTLRPASAEKYVGGTSETGGHFIDQYVIDGQGNAYTIDELNKLLDAGTTASVKYYDAENVQVTDDTVPGKYTARIDIENAAAGTRAGGADETVDVNVGGTSYTFALEPAELVVRSVSDAAQAEKGALNVPLVDAGDADAVKAGLEKAKGGVVAALPDGTKVYFNGNDQLPLADTSGVTLLSDDLLPGQREGELIAHANEKLGAGTVGEHYDFQYLDLVDQQQSNAWVSSSEGTKVFWKVPDGADASSVKVYHFTGLHRDYSATDEEVSELIAKSEVEVMTLDTSTAADGYVSFTVPASGFSPYVMTWDEPAEQKATVTLDAGKGSLPAGASASIEVAVGGTIATLPEPTRTGYEFDGWVTEGDEAFVAGKTEVTGDMTLTATWTACEYEVTLDATGGTVEGGATTTFTAIYDSALGELPEPARDGYTFDGWFTEASGGTEITASTVYATAGESTYYAHWTPEPAAQTVTLTAYAGAGAFEGGSSTKGIEVAKGEALGKADIPTPTRAGYELAGWYLDEGLEKPVVFAEDADPAEGVEATTFTQNANVYAKWIEDVSSDADIDFPGIERAYTGDGVEATPEFGDGFPADEKGKVQVLYRVGASPWSDGLPVSVGSYDVKFVYEGSDEYASFEKVYPAGVVITPAKLTQEGLAANPAEVAAGTKLADIALSGGTVAMSDGTEVKGTWSWADADGAVNASGTYQAVFTPAEGAGNYQPLFADVQVAVSGTTPGGGQGGVGGDGGDDGQGGNGNGGNGGNGGNIVIDSTVNAGGAASDGGDGGAQGGSGGKGAVLTGDNAVFVVAGGAALVAAIAAAVLALLRRRARGNR